MSGNDIDKIIDTTYRTQNWHDGHLLIPSKKLSTQQHIDRQKPCLLSNGAARVGASPLHATKKRVNQEEYCMLRNGISKGATLIPAMIKLEKVRVVGRTQLYSVRQDYSTIDPVPGVYIVFFTTKHKQRKDYIIRIAELPLRWSPSKFGYNTSWQQTTEHAQTQFTH